MKKLRETFGTAGIWSFATLAVLAILALVYAFRTLVFFLIFALVISVGQWQVDHRPVWAAAVLCAFLFPTSSSGSNKS